MGDLPPLDREAIRAVVVGDNAEAIAAFKGQFAAELDQAIDEIANAHAAVDGFRSVLHDSLRCHTVAAFLHSCVYSLTASLHHWVTGYGVACGHMLRHVYESFAMAALCTDHDAQVLEGFSANRKGYRVDKALTKLRSKKIQKRLEASLGLDLTAFTLHLDKNTDFKGRSHSAGLTLAHQILLDADAVVVGGEYDPGKEAGYRADVLRIAALARDIARFAPRCSAALGLDSPENGSAL